MVHDKLCILLAIFITQFLVLSGMIGIISFDNALGQTLTDTTDANANPSDSSEKLTDNKTVNYYARFNCGSISDDSGPLRPGKYDSDITVFNKKDFPITVIWKSIAVNQQYKSNFNILNIPSENIVNINCAKIFPFSQAYMNNATNIKNNSTNVSNNFVEGIVKIEISIDDGLLVNNFLNNQNANMIINSSEIGNLVNVDVLHTVNTLDNLNKEVLYLKTDFSISSKDRNMDNFTAIFHINPDEIIDPISLIKNKLEEETAAGNITNSLALNISASDIRLKNTEIISNTFTDNHALTVQRVEPTIS